MIRPLNSSSKFISQGTAQNLHRLVRYHAVQQLSTNCGATGTTWSLLDVAVADGDGTQPEVRMRFTDISLLANTTAKRYGLYTDNTGRFPATLALTDCHLRGAYFDLNSTNNITVALTNNF